jgi:type VI secretion system protein ImpB
MPEGIHEKLKRVRPPRVHITFDVETLGAMKEKELPFVVGVLGDFSGNPTKELKPLSARRFIMIDRDNIDDVMARMTPGLQFRVENTLKGDGSEMAVNLKFDQMADFEPGNVVQQIEPLRKLLETRDKLSELRTKVDRSEKVESLLEQILKNQSQEIQALATALGVEVKDEPKSGEA